MPNRFMGTLKKATKVGVFVGLASSPAFGQGTIGEVEPNDTFSGAQTVGSDVREVTGEIFGGFFDSYGGYGGEVGPPVDGDVDFLRWQNLTPGAFFEFGVTRTGGGADFIIGQFDSDSNLIAGDGGFNNLIDGDVGGLNVTPGPDDPGGSISGIVEGNGELVFAVSGSNDVGFLGNHVQDGDYSATLDFLDLDDLENVDSPNFRGGEVREVEYGGGPFFEFDFPVTSGERFVIDPLIAIGYDYVVTSGPDFETIILPMVGADDTFTIEWDGGSEEVMAGDVFDFGGTPVSEFTVRGIDPALELNPEDNLAFPLVATFYDDGQVEMTQTPISVIPEPTTATLLGLGLAGLMMRPRRSPRR